MIASITLAFLAALALAPICFSAPAPATFPISYWYGPPDAFATRERYQEIADAGMTFVMPGGSATPQQNKKVLTLCRQVGLKAFIADSRMPMGLAGPADEARLDAIVRDYAGEPSLAGYFLADEPSEPAFAGLEQVVAGLRRRDPKHPAYINLLPNYANAGQLGVPTYPQYVHDFAEQVRPFVLSYDHYHMLTGGDRPGFFENLADVRAESLRAHIPFWQIVLCVQHGPYRNLTEAELRFEAMQTLAYGGHGLLWFTYWQPEDPSFVWRHAMINPDGTHDPHYGMVQRVNREVKALGTPLLVATSTGVFRVTADAPDAGPLRLTTTGSLTIGVFQDTAGHSLALVTNADYHRAGSAQVTLAGKGVSLQRRSLRTGRWEGVPGAQATDAAVTFPVSLPPGGAMLLRW